MMKNTRMSRVDHPMPIKDLQHGDVSELRGQKTRDGTVLIDRNAPSAPKKHRPFEQYPVTPIPMASEEDGKGEAPKKGKHPIRQRGK